MALTRIKVWSPGDVLTAVDLNAEFNNLVNNVLAAGSSPTFVGLTLSTLGLGLAHTSAGGVFSSSLLVNADITAATIDLTTKVTGALPVANGGTGAVTLTLNGVVFGNGTSAAGITAQGPTNSVLTASAGVPAFSATPTVTTLIATTGVTVGVGSTTVGSITLLNATNNNTAVIQAGVTAGNTTWTWPTADGANLQVLSTNGSGVLSFKAIVAKAVLASGNLQTITAVNGANYAGLYGIGGATAFPATAILAEGVIPYAGTLKNLYVRSGPSYTGQYNWYVTQNGVISTITIITGSGVANTTYSDTTHTLVVAAGDRICLNTPNGTGADTPLSSWSVELDG